MTKFTQDYIDNIEEIFIKIRELTGNIRFQAYGTLNGQKLNKLLDKLEDYVEGIIEQL